MYGIPENADWAFLVGRELLQICIGLHQVSLRFDGDIAVNIECDFECLSAAMHTEPAPEVPIRAVTLVSLLGTKIATAATEGGRTLILTFSNADVLRIHDSNDSYESFEVLAPRKHIIV